MVVGARHEAKVGEVEQKHKDEVSCCIYNTCKAAQFLAHRSMSTAGRCVIVKLVSCSDALSSHSVDPKLPS